MYPQPSGQPTGMVGGTAASLAKAPPLPIVLAMIFLSTIIFGSIAGAGDTSSRSSGSPSASSIASNAELCSAYRAVQRAHSDLTGTKDIGPPLVTLSEVAQRYPKTSVQREGRRLSKYSANVIYVENLPAQISNIRFECQ